MKCMRRSYARGQSHTHPGGTCGTGAQRFPEPLWKRRRAGRIARKAAREGFSRGLRHTDGKMGCACRYPASRRKSGTEREIRAKPKPRAFRAVASLWMRRSGPRCAKPIPAGRLGKEKRSGIGTNHARCCSAGVSLAVLRRDTSVKITGGTPALPDPAAKPCFGNIQI